MKQNRLVVIGASLLGIFGTALFYMNKPMIWQFGILALYTAVFFWVLARQWQHLTWQWGKAILSLTLAVGWIYSSHNPLNQAFHWSIWLLALLACVTVSFTFYFFLTELEHPFSPQTRPTSRWWIALYLAIPIAGWLPYFVAYYPAKMNADSFWQWAQAHRITQFNNWHPILDTWIIQLCSLIYNSPATYIVLQLIVMAGAIAFALRFLESSGMPRWLVLALDLFYALNPAVGILAITMWKDILFAAFVFILTVMLAHIVHDSTWLRKKHNMVLFVLVCFLVAALRQNGPEAVGGALLVLVAVGKNLRWRVLRMAVLVIAMFAVLYGPVVRHFHVVPNKLDEALAIPSQQIAATYEYHGNFTPQLKSYFNKILPADRWVKDYDPYTVNPIKWDKKYNATVITSNFPVYLENWARLLRLNPGIFVRAYMNQTAEIWQFSSPKEMQPYLDTPSLPQTYPLYVRIRSAAHTASPHATVQESYNQYVAALRSYSLSQPIPSYATFTSRVANTIGPLQASAKLQGFRNIVNQVFNDTRYNWKNYLIKGAIPFFFLVLGLAASVRRHRRFGLIVYLPALFVIVTFAMAMPATDFRYQFDFAFSVPFLLFYGKVNKQYEDTGP